MKSAALTLVLAVVAPGPAEAQDECIFRIEHIGNQGTAQETPAGTNYFAGGGVRLFCQGTSIRMTSDSVASYRGGDITHFIGTVRYRDSAMALDADTGTWFQDGARWEARGNVFTRNLETGSTLTGPSLDYFRPQTGVRDEASIYAVGRPTILYAVADSAAPAGEPYVIVADRVRMLGDDRIWAGGAVTIDRSDFSGRSDSLWLDAGAGNRGALIGGRPAIEGKGTEPYTLTGERIDLELEDKALRRVIASDSAHAVNDEWDLRGDTVAVRLQDERPDHIDSWGSGVRPLAESDDYRVAADSLALEFPGGRLSALHAIGTAMLETAPDSVTGEPDWIAGDTVLATFASGDSAGGGTALERLEAHADARSFRQIWSPGTGRPGLNYVVGEVIIITMKLPPEEGVDRVDVHGQVQGVQLEPAAGLPPDDDPATRPPGNQPAKDDSTGGGP